jgi:poly(A) polymerase/tRNA nucleotidyltransferase (CCA-adding enzyme)
MSMNIINLYEKYFDIEYKTIFDTLSNSKYRIYLVGGLVRDLILNKQSLDIDVTVEGNAIDFVKSIPCEILSIHEPFGTVKIKINNKYIDIASTRIETYPKKGHLPVISHLACPLKDDILRRDFTVNSLAMSLNKSDFGEIIDYTNGLEDLKLKQLKILHQNSFIDDPSRILRGLKYSSRFNFSLEKETQLLQKKYLENINYDMSYKRILQEFFKIDWNVDVFKKLIDENIYKLINPNIEKNFDFCIHPTSAIVYFGLLSPDEKFDLTKQEKNIISKVNILNTNFNSDMDIYKTFKKEPIETVQILSILGNKSATKFLNTLQYINIKTTGKDLIHLGFKPSKNFQEIFDFLIKNKIENPSLTKEDELRLVKNFFV